MCEFFPLKKKRLRKNQEYKSETFSPTTGVAQGSVVAPMLFLIFISNIPDTPAEISQITFHYFSCLSPVG